MSPEVMTTKQVAEYLQVNPITVTRLAKEGKIPYAMVGARMRFPKAEIDKWLASGGSRELQQQQQQRQRLTDEPKPAEDAVPLND